MQAEEQLYLVVNYERQEQLLFKNYNNACEYANKMNADTDSIYVKSFVNTVRDLNCDHAMLYACLVKYVKNARINTDTIYKIENVMLYG